MKKLSLHWKIIIGMFLGVAVGLIFSSINGGNIIITNWVKPFGTIFINSLKLDQHLQLEIHQAMLEYSLTFKADVLSEMAINLLSSESL